MAKEGVAGLARDAEEIRAAGKSLWALGWERFRRKKLAMVSLSIVLAFYAVGVVGPFFAPYSYREQDLDHSLQPGWLTQPFCVVTSLLEPNRTPPKVAPGPEHLLGTDRLGRDLFSRIIWGMRTSVIVSLAAVITGGLLLGIGLGVIAGFFGGMIDNVIMRIGEILLSFPGILLVALISATIRPRAVEWVQHFQDRTGFTGLIESGFADYVVVFGALSIFGWVGLSRIIRSQVLLLREMDYVTAARALGATSGRIMLNHVFPNTLNLIIILMSFALPGYIGAELVLSWLGIGIQPPTPSLGVMLYENQSQSLMIQQLSCQVAPVFIAPSFVVTVVVFCFALLGDGLNDAFNPRAR